MSETPRPLWTPSERVTADARVTAFQQTAERRSGQTFADYSELWQWSVDDMDGFWTALAEYFEIEGLADAETVLADDSMPGATWFPDSTTNFAGHLLAQGRHEDIAIIGVSENGERSELTRAELRRAVSALGHAYRLAGVGPGDRVVGYIPNIPEAAIAMIAAASIGAIWSSVGMDYAAGAAIDRLGPLEPTVLVYATGYHYGGRDHDRRDAAREIVEHLPTLKGTVEVPWAGLPGSDAPQSVTRRTWQEVLREHADAPYSVVPMGFDDPLWVLFSSGTTGRPKGIVQSHGGILLEMVKFVGLHLDLGPLDRFFWFTSPSWVMWNIQVAALATGASIVCYDGSPTHPDARHLWQIAADTGATLFGSSPGYLEATQATGLAPATDLDLSQLRALATTGSPISPSIHEWAVKASGGLPVYSVSGGTDICGGLCGGVPTVPIWPGELAVRNLGVSMEAWDPSGEALVGEVGELVITRPMPSMPIYFWDDPDGSKYHDAYFGAYPDAWRHGDWITVTERDSVIVHGRSDSTLNRHGVRMGSADIYNALADVPELADVLVLGVEEQDGGYWMPLFVVLADNAELDDALRTRIRSVIRERVSPRHVPDDIIAVGGLPRTRTGKRIEVPLKRLMQGADPQQVIQPSAIDDVSLLAPFLDLASHRNSPS